MKSIILQISLFLFSANLLYGFELSPPSSYEIKYLHNFGDIDGFVQIPKGGKKGTTTPERPEFDDLGIKNINYPELKLKFSWTDIYIYTGINYNTFSGSNTLNYNLITHNNFLEKGSKIKTDHKYIDYQFGIGYEVIDNEKFKVSPLIQFNITEFDYQYDAKNLSGENISSGRKFGFGSLHLGLNTSYQITEKYNLSLNLTYAIPFDNVKQWGSLEIINTYNLFKNKTHELNILFGIGAEHFEFRDTQEEVQNYMKHKIEPIYKVGLEYKFI